MRLLDNKDRVGSMLVLVFSLAYLRYAFDLPLDPTAAVESFTPKTLPIGLSITAILLSLAQIAISVSAKDGNTVSAAVKGFDWKPTLLLVLAMSFYVWLFGFLGFALSSFLFLLCGFFILGERRLLLGIGVASSLVLFLWAVLTQLFGLYLDAGDLWRLLFGNAG
ncbi:MAG: tripartite tricarboxylate transporter TctB family protein [Woeseiaceae bacterium]|nr:tripartite tricarboxylate transporter TctB family protein [Woeseiaceae bacterium]